MTKPTYEQLEARLEMVGELAGVAEKLLEKAQEAYQAQAEELAAAGKAIEKLAAENVTIKTMNDCLSEELRCYESDGAFEGPMMHLLWWQAETPATDAALAEIRAQGVVMFAKTMHADITEWDAIEYAQQLRGEDSK